MRILLTADPFLQVPPSFYGGIERIIHCLAQALRSRGHTVGLIAAEGSLSPVDKLYTWPHTGTGKRAHLRNAILMESAYRDFRPEVVHSFSRLLYLWPLLPLRVPKIMSYQRPPNTRTVAMARRISRGTLVFTGCSDFITRLGSRGGGEWSTIHNFVDLEKYPFTEHVPADAPLVFLSRIEPIKGAAVAIAIAKAAGRRLLLAGTHQVSGSDGEYWEKEIQPELGALIEYVGPVDDARKAQLLAGAAALLVPVQWEEPFGIVFVEALAAGTPVIACPRGALPEIIRSGVDGYLISTQEEALQAISSLDRIKRRDCRMRAETLFSREAIIPRYESLYEALLQKRSQ